MNRTAPGSYRYRGWRILRGSLVDHRGDDRADRWYPDSPHTDYIDRRGPGYRTLRDAQTAIDDAIDYHGHK